MCNLGDPLTVREMIEKLSAADPDAQIRLTSFNYHGEILTYVVHRADWPRKAVLDGEDYVWLSFAPAKGGCHDTHAR